MPGGGPAQPADVVGKRLGDHPKVRIRLEADRVSRPVAPGGGAHGAVVLAHHDDPRILQTRLDRLTLFVMAVTG